MQDDGVDTRHETEPQHETSFVMGERTTQGGEAIIDLRNLRITTSCEGRQADWRGFLHCFSVDESFCRCFSGYLGSATAANPNNGHTNPV